jgi:hypothetical protein
MVVKKPAFGGLEDLPVFVTLDVHSGHLSQLIERNEGTVWFTFQMLFQGFDGRFETSHYLLHFGFSPPFEISKFAKLTDDTLCYGPDKAFSESPFNFPK